MKRELIRLAVYLLVVAGVVSVAAYRHLLAEEERDVYRGLMSQWVESPALREVALLSSPSTCDALPEHMPEVSAELWQAFVSANAQGTEPVQLPLEGDFQVVSWEQTKKLSETEGAGLLFMSTDLRVIKISRVGFADQQALVCVDFENQADLFLLEKKSGAWRVAKAKMVRIS